MIKLNGHKDSSIQFDVDVKNIGDGNLKGYFRLVHESIEYGFPVLIEGRRAKVVIPALNEIIKGLSNDSIIEAKMEFIGGSDYVQAWADTVQPHVPPKVDVKVAAKEKLDVSIPSIEISETEIPKKDNIEHQFIDPKPRPKEEKIKTEDVGGTLDEGDKGGGIITNIKIDDISVPDEKWKQLKSFDEAKKIKTSTDNDHWHYAVLDDEGDGKTVSTHSIAGKPNPHVHEITGAEIKKAKGHIHLLI